MNQQIYQQVAEEIAAHRISWLVTVIAAAGSTPGKTGMKIIVRNNGETFGTIGGGAIEMLVIKKVIAEKPTKPVHWKFDLGSESTHEKTGMICGGMQEVLIDPLFTGHELYIIGGGHCGQALSELAARCEFAVTVIDDRDEFVTPALHPRAHKLIAAPYTEIGQHINFSPATYIVVMTHGHKHDEVIMRTLIDKPYKYLGVIGSNHKVATIFNKMLDSGYTKENLTKLFTPIGLPIGSQTPYEIAVSIMAQLIAIKNDVKGVALNSNPLLSK